MVSLLIGRADAQKLGDDKLVDALATAGLIGAVVAERASLSGAEGGCQAETGAVAGMAAGAGTEMLGGLVELPAGARAIGADQKSVIPSPLKRLSREIVGITEATTGPTHGY